MAIKEIKLLDKRPIPLGFKLSINNKSSHPLQFIKDLKSEYAMVICNCFSRQSIYKFTDLIKIIQGKYSQPPKFQGAKVVNIPIEKFIEDSIKIEELAGIPKRFRGNISDLFLFTSDFELYFDIIKEKYGFLQESANEIYLITKGKTKEIIGFRFDKHLYIVNRRLWRNWTEIICDETTRQILTYYLYTYLYDAKVPNVKPRKNYLTLGADPEFLIYNKNKKEPQLPDYKHFVRARTVLKGDMASSVGIDGCQDVGEIRPQYAHEPKEITKNIRRLLARLEHELSLSGKDYFVEVGGGCQLPIGGHIHIGHPILNDLSTNELKPLLTMLDDFLYYPMKNNMIGALRHWRNLEWRPSNRQEREATYGNLPADSKVVQDSVKRVRGQDQFLSDYEVNSAFRRKDNHGIEYRSLPSFIIDETFTQLVFKIVQQITLKFFQMLKAQQVFKYNNPPRKKDYRHFLTKQEINTFFKYLVGQNKEKFLKNTIDEWKLTNTKDIFLTLYCNFHWWLDRHHLPLDELIIKIEQKIPPKLKAELIKKAKNVVPLGLFAISTPWTSYKKIEHIIGVNHFITGASLYPLFTNEESCIQQELWTGYNTIAGCFIPDWLLDKIWKQKKNASSDIITSLVIDLLKFTVNPHIKRAYSLDWTVGINKFYSNKIQTLLKSTPKPDKKKPIETSNNFIGFSAGNSMTSASQQPIYRATYLRQTGFEAEPGVMDAPPASPSILDEQEWGSPDAIIRMSDRAEREERQRIRLVTHRGRE